MQEFILPKKTRLLWQIRAFVIFLVLLLFFLYLSKSFKIFTFFAAILPLISAFFILWYLPVFFKSCNLKIINNSVIIKRGVFFQNTHIFPFSRLIYTQSFTTPLARIFGLSALTLKAARSRIFVPELETENTKRFLAMLTKGESQ